MQGALRNFIVTNFDQDCGTGIPDALKSALNFTNIDDMYWGFCKLMYSLSVYSMHARLAAYRSSASNG
jgi:hypothetical protein